MTFEQWLEANNWNASELTAEQLAQLEAAFDAEQQTDPPEDPPNPHGQAFLETLAAEREEKARIDAIDAVANQAMRDYPGQLDAIETLVKSAHADKTIEAKTFELNLLRAMRAVGPTRAGRSGGDGVGERVLEAAICKSLKIANLEKHFDERTLDATDKHFKHGIGLQQILFRAAAANGEHFDSAANVRGLLEAAFGRGRNLGIQAAGFSTIDVSGILSDSMTKMLHEYFMAVEQTWRVVGAIRPVRDFRTVNSYSLTGDSQYEQIGPAGEIKHGTLGEQSYTNKADTYAKMLAVTRTDIINDDLGALQRIPQRLGRGAALKINDVFWSTFLNNSSFFTAGNSNVSTGGGSALTSSGAAINAAEIVAAAQTDPDGKPLGLMPRIMLVPPTLFNTATALMGSQRITGGNDPGVVDANVYQGRYRVASSVYMENSSYTGNSAAAWYLLADPRDIPAIETVFLNGRETPVVESADADFDTLGIQVRGYHDFGCSLQEPRCGVRSAGS